MMNDVSWEKLQIKNKIIIFVVGIVIASGLFYNFILVPQWASNDELTAQYHTELQKVKVIEDFVKAHPNAEQHLLQLDSTLMLVNKTLPDNPDISSFLMQIEQLAQDCGLQLISLKPGKTINKEGYREIEVEIVTNGDFPKNMLFINNLENGLRFINVNGIGMKLSKTGLESKLTAKIFTHGVPPAPVTPVAANGKATETKNNK